MRAVRLSRTFSHQLADYIDAGEQIYGRAVAHAKRRAVMDTIRNVLAMTPSLKRRHPDLGLVLYPIATTPFFIVYDYDDSELRVLFVFIKGKPLDDINPTSVEW